MESLGLPNLPWKPCEFPYTGYIEDSTGQAVSNVAVMPDMKSGRLQSRSLEEIAAIARVQATSPKMLNLLLWIKDLSNSFGGLFSDAFLDELDELLAACGLPQSGESASKEADQTGKEVKYA